MAGERTVEGGRREDTCLTRKGTEVTDSNVHSISTWNTQKNSIKNYVEDVG